MTADARRGPNCSTLIDRLENLLESSELSEIEVEAGGTTLVLRKPGAVGPAVVDAGHSVGSCPGRSGPARGGDRGRRCRVQLRLNRQRPRYHAVVAPLTGVYYGSPSPGAAATSARAARSAPARSSA